MAVTINASTSAGLVNTADTSGVLALQTAGTTAVTVDASQNVGIGTSSPATYGNLAVYTAASNTEVAVVSGGANYATYRLQNSSIRYSMQIRTDQSNAWVLRDETAGVNRLLVDTSGNLLVGTTTLSNNEKLTVYQSGSAMGISVRTTGGPALGNYESSDSGHASYWTFGRDNASTGNFVFGYNGTLRGSINLSTGTYTASSDLRLKKNITNITYGLNEVMAMRPVAYLMNEEENTAKKHLGFIAQEVKALIDESVDDLIDPDTQFYMMDKGGLVPVLVKAIQEQQALITQLQADVAALKGATP